MTEDKLDQDSVTGLPTPSEEAWEPEESANLASTILFC